jgi:alkanesulfonate monooxygenase SsuD/methylene tetrahydromethanopterin reductase-like flavin-dependent oxidoreductase (luciferase family)
VPTDVSKPVAVALVIADTDAEADQLARQLLPRWFEVQVDHYAYHAARHPDLPDYRPFAETHQRRVTLTNPANLDPILDVSLVGSPATIRRKLNEYIDIGFNSFILMTSLPDIPQTLRATWLTRFAREIAPEYVPTFARATSVHDRKSTLSTAAE